MLSIIIPFASYESKHINLPSTPQTDTGYLIFSTISVIQNINRTIKQEKEIILVDNTNSFPDIVMPNLRIIKGLQYRKINQVKNWISDKRYEIDNFNNLSMWVSMAYNYGIEHAKGDYILIQHNDLFYHKDIIQELIERIERENLGYVNCDSKKISLSGYLHNSTFIDSVIGKPEFNNEQGGFVKTKDLGFADCYFFLAKRSFFDDYYVDWAWGDSNHGATVKCINNGQDYLHLGPYFDNPNYETDSSQRDYSYNGELFATHLKGGFSENKLSYKIPFLSADGQHIQSPFRDEVNRFMSKLTSS